MSPDVYQVAQARRAAAAGREAVRRYEAREPACSYIPESTTAHHHLGAMLAHVEIMAASLETLIAELEPTP